MFKTSGKAIPFIEIIEEEDDENDLKKIVELSLTNDAIMMLKEVEKRKVTTLRNNNFTYIH